MSNPQGGYFSSTGRVLLSHVRKLYIIPYSTTSSIELPEENYEFSTGFLQAFLEMQNNIVKISSGAKNVRFSASWGVPREYSESIP